MKIALVQLGHCSHRRAPREHEVHLWENFGYFPKHWGWASTGGEIPHALLKKICGWNFPILPLSLVLSLHLLCCQLIDLQAIFCYHHKSLVFIHASVPHTWFIYILRPKGANVSMFLNHWTTKGWFRALCLISRYFLEYWIQIKIVCPQILFKLNIRTIKNIRQYQISGQII